MSIILSKEAIQEFVEIWKREYSVPIEEGLAVIYANKLINLFSSVYRPIPNPDKSNLEDKTG